MNLRVFISALCGGLLATLCLAAPLYFVMPARYDSQWSTLSPGAGLIGILAALVVVARTGYTAARWCWSATLGECLKAGTLTGMLAGMIGYALIGAAAAGLAANAPVLLHGLRPARDDSAAIHMIAESAVRIGWWPYLAFWCMFGGGALLGGLGGWLCRLERAPGYGASPPRMAVEPLDAAFAIMVSTSLSLLAVTAAIAALAVNVDAAALMHGFELSLPARGVIDWPIGMNLAILTTATWFCGRWCILRWHHPLAGLRRTAYIGLGTMAALPLVTLSLLARINSAALRDPIMLVGAAAWVGVVLFWLSRLWFCSKGRPRNSLPPVPLLRDRLLINAGLVGVLAPALVMVSGLSQALSLALGVAAFLDVLLGRAPNVADMPFVPRSLPEAMQSLFAIHLATSLFIAISWFMLAGLHTGVVVFWQSWRKGSHAVMPS